MHSAASAPVSHHRPCPRVPHEDRIAPLDGLRGIAVLLVLVVHFCPDYVMPNRGLEWMKKVAQTGWIGVDVFFVLSGFLITRILRGLRADPHRIAVFYGRRALRIWPLYLASIVSVFLFLPLVLSPAGLVEHEKIQSYQIWYWFHSANVVVLLDSFGAMMNSLVSVSHFWSLAVEEHFYLLWPLLVWRLSYRGIVVAAVGTIIAALGLRVGITLAWPGEAPSGFFVQTFARMDALAMGGLVALLLETLPVPLLRRWSTRLLLPLVLILMVEFFAAKGLWAGSTFTETIGLTILAVAIGGFVCLIATAPRDSLLYRATANPPLRFFGKYSYGLYVIHGLMLPWLDRIIPPEFVLARAGHEVPATVICLVLKISVSVVAAWLSWHVLEQPFLRLKDRFFSSSPHGSMANASCRANANRVVAPSPGLE